MKIKRVSLIGMAFLATVALAGQAYAADAIHIPAKVPYAQNANVRDKVKEQCKLGSKLSEFIQRFAQKDGISVELSSDVHEHSRGKVLVIEITNVSAAGGGAWSGSKSMSASGSLYDNGRLVGTFTDMRYSGGGVFAFYKSTCAIIGRCTKAMGKDIAKWLQHPTHGARLGNA